MKKTNWAHPDHMFSKYSFWKARAFFDRMGRAGAWSKDALRWIKRHNAIVGFQNEAIDAKRAYVIVRNQRRESLGLPLLTVPAEREAA